MGRSIKKGPYVQPKLLARVEKMNEAGEKLCFTMYGQYFLVPKNLTEARMIVSPFCKVYSS